MPRKTKGKKSKKSKKSTRKSSRVSNKINNNKINIKIDTSTKGQGMGQSYGAPAIATTSPTVVNVPPAQPYYAQPYYEPNSAQTQAMNRLIDSLQNTQNQHSALLKQYGNLVNNDVSNSQPAWLNSLTRSNFAEPSVISTETTPQTASKGRSFYTPKSELLNDGYNGDVSSIGSSLSSVYQGNNAFLPNLDYSDNISDISDISGLTYGGMVNEREDTLRQIDGVNNKLLDDKYNEGLVRPKDKIVLGDASIITNLSSKSEGGSSKKVDEVNNGLLIDDYNNQLRPPPSDGLVGGGSLLIEPEVQRNNMVIEPEIVTDNLIEPEDQGKNVLIEPEDQGKNVLIEPLDPSKNMLVEPEIERNNMLVDPDEIQDATKAQIKAQLDQINNELDVSPPAPVNDVPPPMPVNSSSANDEWDAWSKNGDYMINTKTNRIKHRNENTGKWVLLPDRAYLPNEPDKNGRWTSKYLKPEEIKEKLSGESDIDLNNYELYRDGWYSWKRNPKYYANKNGDVMRLKSDGTWFKYEKNAYLPNKRDANGKWSVAYRL